jgi:hypothetical protein
MLPAKASSTAIFLRHSLQRIFTGYLSILNKKYCLPQRLAIVGAKAKQKKLYLAIPHNSTGYGLHASLLLFRLISP